MPVSVPGDTELVKVTQSPDMLSSSTPFPKLTPRCRIRATSRTWSSSSSRSVSTVFPENACRLSCIRGFLPQRRHVGG